MPPLRSNRVPSLRAIGGVALIELIITGVLFLAVAGVTLGTIAKANSTLRASSAATQATALLNRKTAEVRSVSYDAARALAPSCGVETVKISESRQVPLQWTRTIQISPVSGDVQIRHVVRWKSTGTSRKIEASVQVHRPAAATSLAQLNR